MEPLTTQTGALTQLLQEVEHRRGSRAKYKIFVGFLDVTVNSNESGILACVGVLVIHTAR